MHHFLPETLLSASPSPLLIRRGGSDCLFSGRAPNTAGAYRPPQWSCSPMQQRPPRFPQTDQLPPSCPGTSAWPVSSLTARLREEPTASPKPGGWWPGLHPNPTETPACLGASERPACHLPSDPGCRPHSAAPGPAQLWWLLSNENDGPRKSIYYTNLFCVIYYNKSIYKNNCIFGRNFLCFFCKVRCETKLGKKGFGSL